MDNSRIDINKTASTMDASNITNLNISGSENSKIPSELKLQIEKMVDLQFEEEFKKLSAEYDQKIDELIQEQEEISNKNEMIKAKYEALEEYLKNYCKKANIDYNDLLKSSTS